MIQRYEFYHDNIAICECAYFPSADGSWVKHADHIAALTIDDAMVERAWAMMMGRNCVVSYEGGDEIIDGADKDDLRAALTAALERAE